MSAALLEALRARSNTRGVVIVQERGLRADLKVSAEELRADLRKLENAALIEVFSPLPFLVLKLKTWPSKRAKAVKNAQDAYSYSFQQSRSNKSNSYSPDAEKRPTNLIDEILSVLGEHDPSPFQRVVELYPPAVIRTALERVQRAQNIRKSRTALFRHLLPRIAKEFPAKTD